MRLQDLPGFTPNLLHCSFGHDHSHYPVVGSFQDRPSGYGKQPLPSFHCPNCGMAANPRTRDENWRQHPSVDWAMELGNVLPCGMCFKALKDFVIAFIKEGR